MDYLLTEEQKMARDMARKFSDNELKPIADRLDREHTHSPEVLKALGEMGVMGVAVPVEYGGGGMDYISYAMIVTEISRGCGGTGVIVAAHNSLYCYPVLKFGTEEQKERFLTPCASGESVGCYALTEADAGSDPAAMRTTAVLDGDSWVINGEKKFITNGNIADYCVFAAITDRSKGYKGISQFVCDVRETPGFKVGRVEEKLGINASGTAELVFEDARIPKDNILGAPGAGLRQMLETLDSGRISIASQALGIGRAVLEEATAYALERIQFGKPIAEYQAIQWKLADMATQLDAAELLIWRAAWLEDHGMPFEKEAAMAKLYASDVAMQASIEGIQVLGGYGYCKEYPMERHMRDVKITQIYEGTNEIQRMVIARNILGKRK
ncbi:acyl-CoA dehydrogenase [Desulfomonile tiedjei]|uniref:Cyclohexane-1-carbonyl-CoA dehydrogenase n=1 Tax=Desulfomonile tiedjei (strain ATCC 49306 / DSM 6799 / DCB-1) TaxID=706587 RepID=I4CA52_DESTA|nr:acyl-CoA dehydrogenase [Desulfomonile tiedjei]AFM26443.1 acyl-CoA dehydrogenase [Desulfomonile tiedjei DSM 6799]